MKKKVKGYNLFTTSYGETVVRIESRFAFPKWAVKNYGRNWINNKQLIATYSKEQMLMCLKTK